MGRERRYKVYLVDQEIHFPEGKGIDLIGEKAYLPFEPLFEAMGFSIEKGEKSGTVKAEKDGVSLVITLGSEKVQLTNQGENSEVVIRDAVYEKHGVFYVPVRFAADVLGYNIAHLWDKSEGYEKRARAIVITPQMPKQALCLGPEGLSMLQVREHPGPTFTPHGYTKICQEHVQKNIQLLKRLDIIDVQDAEDGKCTYKQLAQAISNLIHGGSTKAPEGIAFCMEKGFLPKDAAADACVNIEDFFWIMVHAMGYTVPEKEYSYDECVGLAWSNGLLAGASAYGPKEYPVGSDFLAIVLGNALTARYCKKLDFSAGIPSISELLTDYRGFTPRLISEVFECDKEGNPLAIEYKCAGKNPYLAVYRADGTPKPVALVAHGWGGDLPSTKGLLAEFADAGYFAVAVEVWGHGERTEDAPVYQPLVGMNTVYATDEVLDDIKASSADADLERIGITGFSMGGQISWQYPAFGKYKVKAMIATHTLNDVEDYYAYPDGVSVYYDPNGTWTWTLNGGVEFQYFEEEYCDRINKELNPTRYPERFRDVAVLHMYGTADDMNDECFKPFMEQLKGIAKTSELFCVEGTDHFQTEEEVKAMVDFFEKWV